MTISIDIDMTETTPSREFQAEAIAQGFGTGWHGTDSDAREAVYSFASLAQMYYRNPKKPRNLLGQRFNFEFHLLSGVQLPNAYAFSNPAGNLFVGITATFYNLVCRVCDQLFADEAIGTLLNPRDSVTASRERRIKVEFLEDLDSRDTIIVPSFLASDDGLPLAPVDGWRSSYFDAGDFRFATTPALHVRDAILSYVFHHEMGHLVEGHLGVLRQAGASVLRESEIESDQALLRQAMEFQADRVASRALATCSYARHVVAKKVGAESDWSQNFTLDCLAI